MLEVKNLTLHYGQSQILYDVSLEAAAGQITCLMGTNGVGKTSLLKAIAGVHPRSGGTIALDGETLGVVPSHVLARKGIAYVPQGREVFPLMTVRENLESGFGCLPKDQHMVPDQIYELFPVLKEMQNRRGGDLSGGQQQQLAIGRALVIEPKLLILDEPGEGIQPNIVAQIGEVIRRLIADDGLTVLLVEQKLPFARKYADRFAILDRGRRVAEGDIAGLTDELIKQHLTV